MCCTMLNLSQASVEYVCKHVTSPNIARRFGHKLYDGEGTENAVVGMEHTSQIANTKMITSEVQTTRSYHQRTSYTGTSLYSPHHGHHDYHHHPHHDPHHHVSYQSVSRSPSTDRRMSST